MFGKELAQQSVEIFIGTAFPGSVRMRKVVSQLQFTYGKDSCWIVTLIM